MRYVHMQVNKSNNIMGEIGEANDMNFKSGNEGSAGLRTRRSSSTTRRRTARLR